MSGDKQKAFEARRYRQQIMLHEIIVAAKVQASPKIRKEAEVILSDLSTLKWSKTSSKAQSALQEMDKRIDRLAKEAKLIYSDQPVYPKWMKFAVAGGTAFLVFFIGFLFFERRRRLKKLTTADVESFKETEKNEKESTTK